MLSGEQVVEQMYRQVDFEKKLFNLDKNYFECSDIETNFIIDLIYLLFIDTEFHAEVASVFGDLYSFNGQLQKFKIDAFDRYIKLKMKLPLLPNIPDNTYAKIMLLLKGYYKPLDKYKTVQSFKRNFIKDIKQRLNMFYEKIETVYKFYYNFKRENDNIHNINENKLIRPYWGN